MNQRQFSDPTILTARGLPQYVQAEALSLVPGQIGTLIFRLRAAVVNPPQGTFVIRPDPNSSLYALLGPLPRVQRTDDFGHLYVPVHYFGEHPRTYLSNDLSASVQEVGPYSDLHPIQIRPYLPGGAVFDYSRPDPLTAFPPVSNIFHPSDDAVYADLNSHFKLDGSPLLNSSTSVLARFLSLARNFFQPLAAYLTCLDRLDKHIHFRPPVEEEIAPCVLLGNPLETPVAFVPDCRTSPPLMKVAPADHRDFRTKAVYGLEEVATSSLFTVIFLGGPFDNYSTNLRVLFQHFRRRHIIVFDKAIIIHTQEHLYHLRLLQQTLQVFRQVGAVVGRGSRFFLDHLELDGYVISSGQMWISPQMKAKIAQTRAPTTEASMNALEEILHPVFKLIPHEFEIRGQIQAWRKYRHSTFPWGKFRDLICRPIEPLSFFNPCGGGLIVKIDRADKLKRMYIHLYQYHQDFYHLLDRYDAHLGAPEKDHSIIVQKLRGLEQALRNFKSIIMKFRQEETPTLWQGRITVRLEPAEMEALNQWEMESSRKTPVPEIVAILTLAASIRRQGCVFVGSGMTQTHNLDRWLTVPEMALISAAQNSDPNFLRLQARLAQEKRTTSWRNWTQNQLPTPTTTNEADGSKRLLVPNQASIRTMIIQRIHLKNHHSDPNLTLASLRENTIKAAPDWDFNEIRKICIQCNHCRTKTFNWRARLGAPTEAGTPFPPTMGQLKPISPPMALTPLDKQKEAAPARAPAPQQTRTENASHRPPVIDLAYALSEGYSKPADGDNITSLNDLGEQWKNLIALRQHIHQTWAKAYLERQQSEANQEEAEEIVVEVSCDDYIPPAISPEPTKATNSSHDKPEYQQSSELEPAAKRKKTEEGGPAEINQFQQE